MHKTKECIFQERANRYSKKSSYEQEEFLEVIEFYIGNEKFALEPKNIREVYPLKDFAFIPCLPSFIYGVINVRRKLISIIDLKTIFNLIPHKNFSPKIIILQNPFMEFGLLADELIGMKKIPIKEIQTKIPALIQAKGKYVKGITCESMIILDGEKLLGDSDLVIGGTL